MTSAITIRVDSELKAEAEEFFEEIGMNMTTGITCFLKKCLAAGEIPFKLGLRKRLTPHEETLAAFEEAKRIAHDPNWPSCDDPAKLEEFLFS